MATTKYDIGQEVWTMHENIPIKCKVEELSTLADNTVWLKKVDDSGFETSTLRLFSEIASTKEQLKEIVFK